MYVWGGGVQCFMLASVVRLLVPWWMLQRQWTPYSMPCLTCKHVPYVPSCHHMCVCLQIMPVENVGFMLKPYGFFMWNPTLDVPPERNAASKEEITPPPRNMSSVGLRARM